MKIKFFLATAGNYAEQDLLMQFSRGVQQWVDQTNASRGADTSSVKLLGRWQGTADPNHHVLEFEQEEGYTACDVAVMFGSWKPREKAHHLIRTSVAANSPCFVCIETALLGRKTSTANTHWRMGINGFLRDAAEWPDLDEDFADQRLAQWHIKWPGWRSSQNGHILVALQLPGDASLRGININDWAYHTLVNLREHTNRRIVVRNHPLASQRAFMDHEEIARRVMLAGLNRIKFSDGQLVPWAEDLKEAYCTVTYSSGLAIDSVLAGIPTVACNPGNFAWPISSNYLDEIDQLKLAPGETVRSWLQQLSMCQYSVDDMRSGLAWARLLPVIERVLDRCK